MRVFETVAVGGCRPLTLSVLEDSVEVFRRVGIVLSRVGLCWLVLARAGSCWLVLSGAGWCLLVMARAGLCSPLLAHAGSRWLVLARAGLCWLVLARVGLCWLELDRGASYWLVLAGSCWLVFNMYYPGCLCMAFGLLLEAFSAFPLAQKRGE